MSKQFITFVAQLSAITAALAGVLHILGFPFFYVKLVVVIGASAIAIGALVFAVSSLNLARSQAKRDDGVSATRAANRARTRHLLRRLKVFLRDLRRAQPGHHLWYDEHRGSPWWLVLGPDGQGKSSLLRAVPDPLEHAPCEPDLPTREPRFFTCPGLAFIEIPEGFEQHPGFAGFVRRIARTRPSQPFAGVLVVARLDDTPSADRLARTRALLHRLAGEFSIRPPVALVVTHLDRLAGFPEFCDGLEHLARPLGVTLPASDSPQAVAQALRARLRDPLAWVRQRCHALVARPRPHQQQSNLHSFWQLFEELAHHACAAATFLAAQPLPGGESLRPRAVYFTAAAVDHATTDAWLGRLAQRAGGALPFAAAAGPVPAQAFLRNIFTTELLRDGPLGARMRLLRWRRASTQAVVAAALASLAVYSVVAIKHAADAEREHMQATWDRARDALGDAARETPRKPAGATGLLALREQVLGWRDDLPFRETWGLHRADLLRDLSAAAYTRAVCSTVLVPLARRSEAALVDFNNRHGNGAVPSTYEQTQVRDHLHLYTLLSDPGGRDPWSGEEFDWLSAQLRKRWKDDDGGTDEQLTQVLQTHADLVPHRPAPASEDTSPCSASQGALALRFDARLADRTSEILALVPREDPVIDRLVHEVNSSRAVRGIELARPKVSADRSIPPAYTRDGWRMIARAIRDEVDGRHNAQWYIRNQRAIQDRQGYCIKLRDNYTERYISVWRDAIRSIRIKSAGNLDELSDILRALLEQKPLRQIFGEIEEHTQKLEPIVCPAPTGGASLTELLPPALVQKLGGQALRPEERPPVLGEFAGFVDYAVPVAAPPGGDKASPPDKLQLDLYHDHLSNLFKKLQQTSVTDSEQLVSLRSATFDAREDVLSQIDRGEFGNWRSDLGKLVRAPLDNLILLIYEDEVQSLNESWCKEVIERMRATTLGRYPFAPDTLSQAALGDINLLFNPTSGVIAQFRDKHLGGFVELSGTSVVARQRGSGDALHVTQSLVDFLDDANKLGRVLFPGDKPSLELTFNASCRTEIAKLVLSIDGTESDYRCGPDQERTIRWPGGKDGPADEAAKPGNKRSETTLFAHGRNGRKDDLHGAGVFGLFRLIEADGNPQRIGNTHAFETSFTFNEFRKAGPVRLTFKPSTLIEGGSLLYGFGDSTTFLAPMRTPRLRNPPEQLFQEHALTCPPSSP